MSLPIVIVGRQKNWKPILLIKNMLNVKTEKFGFKGYKLTSTNQMNKTYIR